MSDLIERLRSFVVERGKIACGSDIVSACNNSALSLSDLRALLAALEAAREDGWQPIETAPKDGSEVLVWRADCGILLARWTAPIEFMTTAELEAESDGNDDWMEEPDWFCADFVSGSRLDGMEAPTHWRPLPATPKEARNG